MIRFCLGISTKKNHLQAIKEAIQEALGKLGNRTAKLALVFSTLEYCHTFVLKTLESLLPNIPIVGCSSRYIFLSQGVLKYGVVILLLDLEEKNYLNSALILEKDLSYSAGQELADKLLLDFKDKPRSFNLIFSARSIENLGFIRGFQEKIGKGFPLIGISLQDRINFHKNFIFYRDFLSDTACLGLLFGGKIDFTWIHKHGWKPLGITHTITKTKDNLISEIDGKPAVRIYQDYLGYDVDKLKKELKYISLLYPLGIYSPSEKNYLLRSITKINDDGTLNTQGEVKENQKVKIMIATKESCLKATKEAIEEIKSLTKRRMNFLLFFESPARVFLLGSEINKELELIKEENLNFVGIMSYGQIFPTNKFLGEIQFHEHSICFLGF